MTLTVHYPPIPSTKRQRQQLLKAYRMRTGRGFTEILSTRLRVQAGVVARVFHGRATSARIMAAIIRELDRVFVHSGDGNKGPVVAHQTNRSADEQHFRGTVGGERTIRCT